MDLTGKNIVVLDLATLRSPDACRHCGIPMAAFDDGLVCPNATGHQTIGWDNKQALGLSVGCYFDYEDSRIHWFDRASLEATMLDLTTRAPLLVSFNGIAFDFAVMRAVLRAEAEQREVYDPARAMTIELCDTFKQLCSSSYDVFAQIRALTDRHKYGRGLRTLEAIAKANSLGTKLSHSTQAPLDWEAKRYATVLNYCQQDVYVTKALFEMALQFIPIILGDGSSVTLPLPAGLQRVGR